MYVHHHDIYLCICFFSNGTFFPSYFATSSTAHPFHCIFSCCLHKCIFFVVVFWFAIFTSKLFACWNIIKFAISLLHCMVWNLIIPAGVSWQFFNDNINIFLCSCKFIREIFLILFWVKLIYKTTHQLWESIVILLYFHVFINSGIRPVNKVECVQLN